MPGTKRKRNDIPAAVDKKEERPDYQAWLMKSEPNGSKRLFYLLKLNWMMLTNLRAMQIQQIL